MEQSRHKWPVIQVTSCTTFDLNRGHKVHYSDHGFNNRPFNDWAGLNLSNIGLVCYSDPNCVMEIQAPDNFAIGMCVSSLVVKRSDLRMLCFKFSIQVMI